MQRISTQLGLASMVRISNVWLLETNDGRFLFDAGHPIERLTLRAQLWRAGVRGPGDLRGVILTHRHSDHAGNASWLRRTFDCAVYCHEADAPYLTGSQTAPRLHRPGLSWYGSVMCKIEDTFPARTTIDDVFTEGEWRFGLHIFPVPGHTEGSALLYHQPSKTLFTGDSILAGLPVQRLWIRLYFASTTFSDDAERAQREVEAVLRSLPSTEILCSGHGPAVTQNLARHVKALQESKRRAR
jgi:glyoxylase-like metal-dependent hydrolase (beta-lactamase superfamily II)